MQADRNISHLPFTPRLLAHLLWDSFKLLSWLIFRPSALHRYISHIEPPLPVDFSVAELCRAHWRHPSIYRLLLIVYVVWPVLVGLLVGAGLWAIGLTMHSVVFGMSFSIGAAWAYCTYVGIAGSVIGSVLPSISFSAIAAIIGSMIFDQLPPDARLSSIGGSTEFIPSTILSTCFAAGVAGSSAIAALEKHPERIGTATAPLQSLLRPVGSIVIGAFVGFVSVGLLYALASIPASSVPYGLPFVLVYSTALGIGFGLLQSIIVFQRTHSWLRACAVVLIWTLVSLSIGILGSIGYDIERGIISSSPLYYISAGVTGGALVGALFVFPYHVGRYLGGNWAGAIAGSLSGGTYYIIFQIVDERKTSVWSYLPIALACVVLGLTFLWWRPLCMYPFLSAWNTLLYSFDQRRAQARVSLLRWHSAFWDEFQPLPFYGLEEYLLLVARRNLSEALEGIAYLATGRQRWAAQFAQIEIELEKLHRCTTIEAISEAGQAAAPGDIEGPASSLLRHFSRVSGDIRAALQYESSLNQRWFLTCAKHDLERFIRDLALSDERFARRALPIAQSWLSILERSIENLAQLAEQRQEIDSPYIVGLPLTQDLEIFVGRADIAAQIERLLRSPQCPPILLYGQRRMGKTSLLYNLSRLLPTTIVPLFVDLQGCAAHDEGHAMLLYNIARDMRLSALQRRNIRLPILTKEALSISPFTGFTDWLEAVEQTFSAHGCQAILLALDELETLYAAISEGIFSERRVLGMLRHIIQHRPRFKVLLAGSHLLSELYQWSSYLINVQIVKIGYLQASEARDLIERPVKNFTLSYEPPACQRVLDLTRGHPYLVQLLCREIVMLKNEQDPSIRHRACVADVDQAVPMALNQGSLFFADIQYNRINADGLKLLHFLATHSEAGTGVCHETLNRLFAFDVPATLDLLTQRDLIEDTAVGVRFQIELIRQWFASLPMK